MKTDIHLTRQEKRILLLIKQGYSAKEIARELAIAHRTVESHMANIYKKIDVPNRVAAVVRAMELELLP